MRFSLGVKLLMELSTITITSLYHHINVKKSSFELAASGKELNVKTCTWYNLFVWVHLSSVCSSTLWIDLLALKMKQIKESNFQCVNYCMHIELNYLHLLFYWLPNFFPRSQLLCWPSQSQNTLLKVEDYLGWVKVLLYFEASNILVWRFLYKSKLDIPSVRYFAIFHLELSRKHPVSFYHVISNSHSMEVHYVL